jgi:rhamnosyltransferase subunit B
MNAGIPHLVVPNAHDQFDSGWRIERLGLGQSIWQKNYRADRAARAIRAIIDDKALRQRCVEYAGRFDSSAALTRACELLEGLPAKSIQR